jgi:hypothetical protein
MTMNNSSSEGEGPDTAAVGKKPYEKPSFRYEEVFVTSALTCAKVSGGSCAHLLPPRSS